jgi:hypothetical protein
MVYPKEQISMYYALSSPFPPYTYCDHIPLKWMEKTEKGATHQLVHPEIPVGN